MAELKEFKLPDVGEGLTEADIVAWHVKPGEEVEDGQIIVEIETAKAVVELPCPWDGTVARLLAEEGQTVEVGVPIIAVEVAGRGDTDRRRTGPGSRPAQPRAVPRDWAESPGTKRPVRTRSWSATASRPRRPPAARAGRPARPRPPAPGNGRGAHRASRGPAEPPEVPAKPARQPAVRALAKPPVRKLAKDLGISLAALAGSGPDGSITRDDVQRAAAADTPARSAESGNGSRTATSLRSPAARSASRSAACASTWPRPWCRARSPRRTSPSSFRST